MKNLLSIGALAALAILACARPALSHVGSPDVFYEGDAGPYHLFVTVRVPQVIPGVAEVEVRASSDDVREIKTAVARLTGAGSHYAPVPDLAKRSTTDPRFFSSSLWLMEYGSLRVLLKVNGTRGPAELSVPVASFGQSVLKMPRGLGALLLVLAIGLALGAISIVGAAAREARVTPGAEVSAEYRRRGWRAMSIMTVLVAAIFYLAFSWWSADAKSYAMVTKFFKSPKCSATLIGNRISIRPTDKLWLKNEDVRGLVPDHGHIMHLFLVRTPGLDRIWHLHPLLNEDGAFEENLPALDSGHYEVFADIVDKYGFPWTLVGTIDLPNVLGPALSGDDSEGIAKSLTESQDTSTSVLADGTQVVWNREAMPLKANVPMILDFAVKDPNGAPANDLEPYMGMAAHAEIIRDDLSVFAHIHPSGSASMAAMMMASADTPGSSSMAGMEMPAEKIAPTLSMPYGFPKPGEYRIFLQFKRASRIETASFDAHVL
ncbi:MAG TPA: hypothetical protein VN867_02555 [Candidatus Binataceae bacterium]|nr:hypothetical protein [Candidatus Binataceae bacterium]